ncbi:polyol transporter 5-like [Syzygium oleosum]|uniref:polyol transporter 5-like n=1 Tax=Syzygium oleosum TaxID=219896 RepID=UPI0024B8801E|nr:polyol transporter 5-like [Syzygium oleosum]
MSGAAAYIKVDVKLPKEHINVLTGYLRVFTFLGLATARWISNQFGRHKTIMMAGAMYFGGPLLRGFSPTYSVFLAGHSCATFGAGFALMIVSIYAAEVYPIFFHDLKKVIRMLQNYEKKKRK